MELKEDFLIAAPRAQVYAALNDPEILRQAIPGCEELLAQSPTELTATVATKIGPLSVRFKGALTLADLDPPASYTLAGEGKGGPAGFVKVKAWVKLAEEGPATRLAYEVKAEVGGKLAQLGGPLIERTSKKLAGEFFDRFQALLGAAAPPAGEPAPQAAPAARAAIAPLWWLIAAVVAGALAYVALR